MQKVCEREGEGGRERERERAREREREGRDDQYNTLKDQVPIQGDS